MKERPFVAPLFVAGPDVGDTQTKEATDSVQIRRCFTTRTSTSPGPATGSGYSSNLSTSGPPYWWTTTAFIFHLLIRCAPGTEFGHRRHGLPRIGNWSRRDGPGEVS